MGRKSVDLVLWPDDVESMCRAVRYAGTNASRRHPCIESYDGFDDGSRRSFSGSGTAAVGGKSTGIKHHLAPSKLSPVSSAGSALHRDERTPRACGT